jgi:hypothetical protein
MLHKHYIRGTGMRKNFDLGHFFLFISSIISTIGYQTDAISWVVRRFFQFWSNLSLSGS